MEINLAMQLLKRTAFIAAMLTLFCLPLASRAQELIDPVVAEATVVTWQPPDLTALPTEWWSQFAIAPGPITTERTSQFLSSMDERIEALVGEDMVTAQNSIANLKNQFELLAVAKQGPSEDRFDPIAVKEVYFLADFLALRSQARELEKKKVQVKLLAEQTESRFKLLQERRDKVLRQYDAADTESPTRILLGISWISARVEYEVALTRSQNLRQRLKGIDKQYQLLTEQLAYSRNHLVNTDLDLAEVKKASAEARAKVTAATEKVAALQPQLLEALSAELANPSLEILRKQQMTWAVAGADLAQLQEALARSTADWYHHRAKLLDIDFDFQAAMSEARQLTADSLEQADLWTSICQSTLIASPPASNLNAVKNFELAQSVARETLAIIDQIRNTSDDLLLVQDILSTDILTAQSGLHNAWGRLGLASGKVWDRIVGLAEFDLFEIGDTAVSPAGIFKMLLILVLAFGISRLIRYLLNRSVGADKVSQKAALYTLGRLLHYIIILIGIFAALGSIGIDFTSFALIAGALSVGIGFGLQAIVNNFVSGLILLFEGTLRVGDYIELDSGVAGVVREINTRATIVNTNDSVDVVVPNSELVTTKLTNWTLRETVARMRIPFGVAYGSDKEEVKRVAFEAANETDFVLLHTPGREPQLRLWNFGDNALEFEMLVWVSRQGVRRPHRVRTSFLWNLETRLRENNIEIPFPQRDIHVRSDFRAARLEPEETAPAPDDATDATDLISETTGPMDPGSSPG